MKSEPERCTVTWRYSPAPGIRSAPDAPVFQCVRKAGHPSDDRPAGGHTALPEWAGR